MSLGIVLFATWDTLMMLCCSAGCFAVIAWLHFWLVCIQLILMCLKQMTRLLGLTCAYAQCLWEVGLNIKPFCAPPHWGVPRSFLRNLFLGKFSRWWNIRPPENDWKRACLRLLFDLRLASWPRSTILSTLFSIAHLDFLHTVSFSKNACKFVWANCTPQRAA